MKRLLFTLTLLYALTSANAQMCESVHFELQSDGTFRTADGNDYVILDFNGQSASELYQRFLSASVKGYATERRRTSEIENVSFAIEGISDTLVLKGSGTLIMRNEYQIMFHFKDGRVKVDAPVLTTCYAAIKFMGLVDIDHMPRQNGTFSEWVKANSPYLKFKDGKPAKENYLRNWSIINRKTNELLNCVLRQLKLESEDW